MALYELPSGRASLNEYSGSLLATTEVSFPMKKAEVEMALTEALIEIYKLRESIGYAVSYLDHNELNAIGSGSKAHVELSSAIAPVNT